MNKLRKIIKIIDDTEVECRMSELRKGDHFKAFDDDVQVGRVWIADADPTVSESADWEPLWGIIVK